MVLALEICSGSAQYRAMSAKASIRSLHLDVPWLPLIKSWLVTPTHWRSPESERGRQPDDIWGR